MAGTSVFIVDDHPIFREGLAKVLSGDDGIIVVGEAADGKTALEGIRRAQPEVALLDVDIPPPNGLQVARALQAGTPPIPVVILTMYKEQKMFDAAMAEGVRGYVLKENASEDVISAVKTVAAGEIFLTPSINHYLLERRQRIETLHATVPGLDSLTAMEKTVLRLVACDLTSKEIAANLHVSPRTVETHRSNIAKKLELQGAHGVIRFAIEHRFDLE